MASTARWEYKTVLHPSIDEWLAVHADMALDAAISHKYDKIVQKHCEYLNETMSALGKDGWELVAMWENEPTQLFTFTAKWLTFKRRNAAA